MKRARIPFLLAALSALLALPAAAKRVETWTGLYPLAAGGRVSVENVQGSIWVEVWDRAEVQLTIVKTAAGSEAALDQVAVAIRPASDWLQVATSYTGGADEDEAVVVDFRLRVPRQVHLKALRTVNGDILVHDVEGAIEARTLNGRIEQAGVAGDINARTLNGDVSVILRGLPQKSGALELESINGDVSLLLPPDADADLEMSTVAGRIETPAPFNTRAVSGQNSARARLGRGGVQIHLRTVRGNVRVAERDATL